MPSHTASLASDATRGSPRGVDSRRWPVSHETMGMRPYEPLVRELILNGLFHVGLVGGFAGTGRNDSQSASLHTLSLITNNGLPGRYILAEIRLFAEFNGPTNYVVVGRWL
jgi:hypothetical protein